MSLGAACLTRTLLGLPPTAPIGPEHYERALDHRYADLWRPETGSPLYTWPEGAHLRTRKFFEQVVPLAGEALLSLPLSAGHTLYRWRELLRAHGPAFVEPGLLPSLEQTAAQGALTVMLERVAATERWEDVGQPVCGPGGARWSEFVQGRAIADCSFLSVLASIGFLRPARLQPVLGGAHPRFRFFHEGVPREVPVDERVRVGRSGLVMDAHVDGTCSGGGQELWAALWEKAYALHRTPPAERRDPPDLSYIGGLDDPAEVLPDVLGGVQSERIRPGDPATTWAELAALCGPDGATTAVAITWTRKQFPPEVTPGQNLRVWHCYSFFGVLEAPAGRFVVLRNPDENHSPGDAVLARGFAALAQKRPWRDHLGDVWANLVPVPLDLYCRLFSALVWAPLDE